MTSMLKYLWMLLLILSFSLKASVVDIVHIPDWVVLKTTNINVEVPKDEVTNGTHYLLVDKQTLIQSNNQKQSYRHYTTKVLNPKGVESMSQIDIDYDPNYQSIVLHQVTVRRNGIVIDKTKTAKMILLQREENLEKLIYDGDITLNILLDDIQVNDIIDYSFSVSGNNPVFNGGFSLSHSLNWSVPLESLYLRVLWQKKQKLHYKISNSSLEISQRELINGTEYLIEDNEIKPFFDESNMPSWFNPYGSVVFSDVKDWQQVVQWGKPLFDEAIVLSPEIKKVAADIQQSSKSKSKQIAEILKYVQTNVRYLGIEFGENSHRPSPAEETLRRHYGDCKDKVVLLNTLLKEIGVTAYPALVNTKIGDDLPNQLARYTAFDHVITLVEYNNKYYWLDPTRLNQSGDLDDIFQPDYSYALILNTDSTALTKVNIQQANSKVVINEVYNVHEGMDSVAEYTVHSQYTHLEADTLRGHLIDKSLAVIRTNYLKFYQDYYPTIKVKNPAIFNDDLENNEITIAEQYTIDKFWETHEKDNNLYGYFYSNLITPYISFKDEKERKYPMEVSHPIIREQNIDIYFDDDNWSFEKNDFIEDNPFFVYKSSILFTANKKKLSLKYSYHTKTDMINPEDIKSYIAALKNLKDYANFGIYKPMNAIVVKTDKEENDDAYNINIIILATYVSLLLLSLAWWRFDVSRNKFSGEMKYYPVTIFKFLTFWVATFSLYAMYWNYKNWKYIKQRDSLDIMPIARSIFYIFWYYSLHQKLAEENEQLEHKGSLFNSGLATFYALLFFFVGIFGNFMGYELIALIISGLLVTPLVNFINFINRNIQGAIEYNSQWNFRHSFTLALCIPLFLLTVGSEIGILPNDAVITGDKILNYDLKYLQRKGVLKPQDKVQYFYSDALFFVQDDGNGFTSRHVFSYWKTDGKFESQSSLMHDIKDLEVTWAKNALENTLINVIKNDESSFLLFVSAIDRKDKIFVKELKKSWKNSIKKDDK